MGGADPLSQRKRKGSVRVRASRPPPLFRMSCRSRLVPTLLPSEAPHHFVNLNVAVGADLLGLLYEALGLLVLRDPLDLARLIHRALPFSTTQPRCQMPRVSRPPLRPHEGRGARSWRCA